MRHLVFVVAGERRSVPRKWWAQLAGPRPDACFACDGCSWSPDRWRGYEIWPACVVHDFHYRTGVLGGTWRSRQIADAAFYHNIVVLVKVQGGSAFTAHSVASFYWGRVRVWGKGSYRHWDDPKSGLPWYRRVAEAWGLRK